MIEQGTLQQSVSAATVKRLGEELIKDSQTAFVELIKNSYDADANTVEVRFQDSPTKDGCIVIQDDGTGMTLKDINTKWLRTGGENKVRQPYSSKYNRRRLGAKGIGRFSVAKLGRRLKMITKTSSNRQQLALPIDFEQYTDDKNLNDMEVAFKKGTPRQGFQHGTILEVTRLSERWGRREIAKLRSQLSHLVDPEQKDQDFTIVFECRDHPDLEGALENPIAGQESHRMVFSIDGKGKYTVEMRANHGKPVKKRESRKPLICGPVRGVLRYYKEGLKSRDRKLTYEGDESHMGVKVVRDNFRVRPYGETADDWLQIKSRRARAGGKHYIKPDLLAGTMYISATTNGSLQDETNREAGMIPNKEYHEFQQFIQEHVNYLNSILEQETKSESQKQKRHKVQRILDTVIKALNQQESPIYKGYVERIDRTKRGSVRQTIRQKDSELAATIDGITKKEWHCIDCGAAWRTLKTQIPKECLQYAVNRKGELRDVSGCGSTNIEEAKHEARGGVKDIGAIVSGQYALISGKRVNVRVDYDMGEYEDEYSFSEREIVINGNHPAYRVAERLDGKSGMKYEIGDDTYVAALTVQITKCVCLAWAELHFKENKKDWDEYKSRYDQLQSHICNTVLQELQIA